jgi:hypothetical protein
MAWFQRGILARRSTAVAAIAVVAAIAAAVVWGSLGGGASRRLLAPLIEYHKSQYEINRDRWQSDLEGAREWMGRTNSKFDNVKRMAQNALSQPVGGSPLWANAWEDVKSEMRGAVEDIDLVGEQLRDASMHENMAIYHSHMRFYYEGLLKDRAIRLPPLPASLEAERWMIETALLRRYGEGLPAEREESKLQWHYESEPPPHLADPPRRRF